MKTAAPLALIVLLGCAKPGPVARVLPPLPPGFDVRAAVSPFDRTPYLLAHNALMRQHAAWCAYATNCQRMTPRARVEPLSFERWKTLRQRRQP